jgi:hypothetical protein
MSTPWNDLLNKKVSRGQFLRVAGLGVLSLLGMSTIIHFLTGKGHPKAVAPTTTATTVQRKGFGRF